LCVPIATNPETTQIAWQNMCDLFFPRTKAKPPQKWQVLATWVWRENLHGFRDWQFCILCVAFAFVGHSLA